MVLHVALVLEHLLEAVEAVLVRHCAIGHGTHGLHADANRVEGHAGCHTASNGHTGGPEAVDPGGTQEEVRVLLAPIVNVGH